MGSPDVSELLPPPLPAARPFPWRPVLALFLPAAALAAGTGLQRVFELRAADPVLQWLALSSAAGAVFGLVVYGFRRALAWPVYAAIAPWLVAGAVLGVIRAVRPLRELAADRREAACRAAGRTVCTMAEFSDRCARARANYADASVLLGEPRTRSCTGATCTSQWVYPGPFRPEQYAGPGALACFVVTDAEKRGLRHWFLAVEAP